MKPIESIDKRVGQKGPPPGLKCSKHTLDPLGLRVSITSGVGAGIISDRQTLNNEYVSFLDVST